MTKLRLQKIIANAGICSRRKAELLLAQERVTINGETAKIGDKADPDLDHILVDECPVVNRFEPKLILLNKPLGVVSTCSDPYGRATILELLPSNLRKGMHPVGRLDFNSRGAMLITNQGKLTLQLTHPRYSHNKTYSVLVMGVPSEATLNKWRRGVLLDSKMTLRASVKLLSSEKNQSLLKIIIREGRNRQIRRMAQKLGHPVIDLQRTAIGSIQLNGLREGDWRRIKLSELKLIECSSR